MLAPQRELRKLASPSKAKQSAKFFKTGPGEYGEGDVFIGVTVPEVRMIAKQFQDLSEESLKTLLESSTHEDRLLALLILVIRYKNLRDDRGKRAVLRFYLKNKHRINNWDLVDTSAYHILGSYACEHEDLLPINKLARSKRHWDRRMAMISTFAFIQRGKVDLTFKLAAGFLEDREDLMHKATGWMLREAGKKDLDKLKQFLEKFSKKMPRTMLRYAIERFPKTERLRILQQSRS